MHAASFPLAVALAILPGAAFAADGDLPAEKFDSKLGLAVYARGPDGRGVRLGRTPTEDGEGIALPKDGAWWVERSSVRAALSTWEELAAEIRAKGIPGLEVSGREFGPWEACKFKDLAGIRFLVMRDLANADVVLPLLAGWSDIEHLDLSGSDVTAAGLAQLRALKGLRHLDLSHARMRPGNLRFLPDLPRLESLGLGSWEFANADWLRLGELGSLRRLDLRDGKGVTAAGLARLSALPHLRELDLSRRVRGPACGNCDWVGPAWPGQESSRSRLRDSALKPLALLASLERLDLDGQPLTWKRVSELTRALPNCSIEWTPPRR